MTESELTKEFNDFFGLEREKHIEISALECKNFARHMMQKERERQEKHTHSADYGVL